MSHCSDSRANRVLEGLWRLLRDEFPEEFLDSHGKGKKWEEDFKEEAKKRGLHVETGNGRADVSVNGLLVQCKNVDQVQNGFVAIDNMRPVKANEGKRGYFREEVDVLALKHGGGVYLIHADSLLEEPGWSTKLKSRIRIEAFKKYLDCWSVFDNDFKPPQPLPSLFNI